VRERFRDGGGFAEAAAYSRAVRHESYIAVSGTTSFGPDGALHPGDSYRQAKKAIRRALVAAAPRRPPRGRDPQPPPPRPGCRWDAVVRAHREEFEGVESANTTYYVGGLVPPGVLVEVELDAVVEEPPR